MGRYIHTLQAFRLDGRWGLFDYSKERFVAYGGRKQMKARESGYFHV